MSQQGIWFQARALPQRARCSVGPRVLRAVFRLVSSQGLREGEAEIHPHHPPRARSPPPPSQTSGEFFCDSECSGTSVPARYLHVAIDHDLSAIHHHHATLGSPLAAGWSVTFRGQSVVRRGTPRRQHHTERRPLVPLKKDFSSELGARLLSLRRQYSLPN